MPRFLRIIWESYKEVISLLVILIISLVLISQNNTRSIKRFRVLAFSSIAGLSSSLNSILPSGGSRAENEHLRRRNAELMLQVCLLTEYQAENKELRGLLSLKDTIRFLIAPAKVAFRSVTNSQTTLVLDKGTDDNVQEGYIVVDEGGLLGIVSEVSTNYSIVKSIKNNSVNPIVRERKTKYQGILHWTGASFTVTNIPKTADTKINDTIITAATSSLVNFPLPIGRVSRVINPEQGYMTTIEIVPFANIDRADFVFILMQKPIPNYTIPR